MTNQQPSAHGLSPDQLLDRLSTTMRRDIGPEVGDAFAKTQAFMASVILEKLSGQLRLADAHALADRADRLALVSDLDSLVDESGPAGVHAAINEVKSQGDSGLATLVAALYSARGDMDPANFERVLARIRVTLRSRLDRQLEYAS